MNKQKQLQDPDRRRFLELALLGGFGLAFSGLASCITTSQPKIDLSSMLNQPATKVTDRKFPPYGTKADAGTFGAHRMKPFYNTAGIDCEPVVNETEIRPVAAGVVVSLSDNSMGGKMIYINHGIGFASLYAHLKERLVKEGDFVNRYTPIGIMGSTGTGASKFGTHLHLSAFGPQYTEYLKLDNIQKESSDRFYLSISQFKNSKDNGFR